MDSKVNKLLDGVNLTPLGKFADERGMLLHMMKNNFDVYDKFGEIYFSFINPGVVKGWKKHKEMVQNFAVPVGTVKIVMFDGREASSTFGKILEVVLSQDNYKLLTIPSEIYYSFSTISDTPGMIANCASIVHDPEESQNFPIDTKAIPYNWWG